MTIDYLLHPNAHSHLPSELASDEEREVTATIIQWLGSLIGFNWLEEVLKRIEKEGEEK